MSSSETIPPPASADVISKNNGAVENDATGNEVGKSTTDPATDADAADNSAIEKQDDTVPKSRSDPNTNATINVQPVNENENKNENDKSKTPRGNDLKSTEELKADKNMKLDSMDTNDNDNDSDKDDTFKNRRMAKKFRVLSTNKIHQNTGGKVNKIFFGTVEKSIPGNVELWRILYDDGDVDVMSRVNLKNACKFYDENKKYDINHTHKKPSSVQALLSEEEEGASSPVAKKRVRQNNHKSKGTPPKKSKKTKSKVAQKQPIPVSSGPPDEEIDGGWPEGWVKKVFLRKNGASKGSSDRYWYTPKEKYKLRSLLEVRRFRLALVDTEDDEVKAKATMNRYK